MPTVTVILATAAIVVTAGYKGVRVLQDRFESKEAIVRWERGPWFSRNGKTYVDPLLARIEKCNRKLAVSSRVSTQILCRIQKTKLLLIYYSFKFLGCVLTALKYVVPGCGGGAIPYVLDSLLLGGFITYAKLVRGWSVRLVRERLRAFSKSVRLLHAYEDKTSEDQQQPSEDTMIAEVDDMKPEMIPDFSSEPDSPDIPLEIESSDRRFCHGFLSQSSQSSEISEISRGREAAVGKENGSDVDFKLKKEVRFCDEYFDNNMMQDGFLKCERVPGKASQRLSSTVKRIRSESSSKIRTPKVTRSIPGFTPEARF